MEKNKSQLVLLFFDKEQIPTHVKLGYVKYAVRAFVPKPQQKNCKGFGHVSNVCRRTEDTEERRVEGRQCCNCGGDHDPEFLECPVRVKKTELAKVRAVNLISYAKAIQIIEKTSGASEEMVVYTPQPVGNVCCQTKYTVC